MIRLLQKKQSIKTTKNKYSSHDWVLILNLNFLEAKEKKSKLHNLPSGEKKKTKTVPQSKQGFLSTMFRKKHNTWTLFAEAWTTCILEQTQKQFTCSKGWN